jgi:SAM-dependent methyltransferase
MNWKCKAFVQKLISSTPYGESLNYLGQKWITKNLPSSDNALLEEAAIASEHLDSLRRYGRNDIENASLYEFGAGWELQVALYFYCAGLQHQTLVDIRKLLRLELINRTIEGLGRLKDRLHLLRTPEKLHDGDVVSVLQANYGITYLAPCDARSAGLPAESFDFITSTNTMEHIPPDDLRLILQECYRLLKRDGVMSFKIDYQDHYSYFDPRISAYNFLCYSDRAWANYNSALHYQNRLRHHDYLELIAQAGFVILEDSHREGDDSDVRLLQTLGVDPAFRTRYELRELAIRASHIVSRKPGATN